MKAVPGSSVVAVLSTAAMLLPASAPGTFAPTISTLGPEYIPNAGNNSAAGGEETSDVFVGYERLKSTSSFLTSSSAPNQTDSSDGSRDGASGSLSLLNEDGCINAGVGGEWSNKFGHTHHRSDIGTREKLLVTAIPSRRATQSQCAGGSPVSSPLDGGSGLPWVEGKREHGRDRRGKAQEAEKARPTSGPSSRLAQWQLPAKRLSNAAPLPLLVFDTETFVALGELDEQFAFQGGVAEWINRATFSSRDNSGGTKTDMLGTKRRTKSDASRSDQTVRHVDKREWGTKYVGSCPEARLQPGGSSIEQSVPIARSPSVDRHINDVPEGGVNEQLFFRQGAGADELFPREDSSNLATSGEVIIDQWNRLPLAKLDALLQADVDLFFLRLLLLPPPSGELDVSLFPRFKTRRLFVWGMSITFVLRCWLGESLQVFGDGREVAEGVLTLLTGNDVHALSREVTGNVETTNKTKWPR